MIVPKLPPDATLATRVLALLDANPRIAFDVARILPHVGADPQAVWYALKRLELMKRVSSVRRGLYQSKRAGR